VHHSVAKACRLAGVGQVRSVAVDRERRMNPVALRAAIEADAHLLPFLIVATAGTTNTGAIDPIDEIADVAHELGLWLHIDGAYGGAWVLCDEGRERLGPLHRADSIALDPHKGMFLPYGTGCLLVRDGALLASAHGGDAAYLQDIQSTKIPSPAFYGPELSRPYRGLRLWLPLMLHGAGAFRRALSEKLELAHTAWLALSALELDVVERPQLTTVAFRARRREAEALQAWNARTVQLLDAINARGRVFLSSTDLDGAFTIRVCVVSFRSHAEHVAWLVEDVAAAIDS
jgi:glutamate/tyrosine decarboxylase-like PLP-dependent enzyme